MIIGGIDPGLVATGYGVLTDGVLTHAGIVRGNPKLKTSQRVDAIALELFERLSPLGIDVLAVEHMVYRGGKQRTNPAILLALNLVAGACWCLADKVNWYVPTEWKGRLDKDVAINRMMLTLSTSERKILEDIKPASLRHNAADGVGLALFESGRLTPHTVKIKPR